MSRAGLSITNPVLSGGTSLPDPKSYRITPASTPDMSGLQNYLGESRQSTIEGLRESIRAEREKVRETGNVLFSPSLNKFSVGGAEPFEADDYAAALGTESLIGQPAVREGANDWVELSPDDYRASFIERIKNPSIGERVARNYDIGVANYLSTLGGVAQFAGFEDYGANLVLEQERAREKLAPFVQDFTTAKTPEDIGAAVIGVLAQQGPNALEAVLLGAAGAVSGAALGAGNPLVALGGAVASVSGRQAIKGAMLEAARKYAAKEALTKADMTALRAAKQLPEIMSKAGGTATRNVAEAIQKGARQQAGLGGAIAATTLGNFKGALGETYLEQREQGAGPGDIGARFAALGAAVPFTALDTAGDILTGGLATGMLSPTTKTAYRSLAEGVSKPVAAARIGGEALKRGAKAAAVSAPIGGATEVGQEAILLASTGQDFSDPKNVNRLLESFYAGMAAQGAVDSIANIVGPVDVMKRQALPNPNRIATETTPTTTVPPTAGTPEAPPAAGPTSYGTLPVGTVEPPAPVAETPAPVAGTPAVTPDISMTEGSTVISDTPVEGEGLTRRKIGLSNGLSVTIEKSPSGWNIIDERGTPLEFLGTKKADALAKLASLAVGSLPPGVVTQQTAGLQQELTRVDATIAAINRRMEAISAGQVEATPEEITALQTQLAQATSMRNYIQGDIAKGRTAPVRTAVTPMADLYQEAVSIITAQTVRPTAPALAQALDVDEKTAKKILDQMVESKVLTKQKNEYALAPLSPEASRQVDQDRIKFNQTLYPGGLTLLTRIPALRAALAKNDLDAVLDILAQTGDAVYADIAKRARYLKGIVNFEIVPAGQSIEGNPGIAAAWYYRDDKIKVTARHADDPATVAHELIHALTSLIVRLEPESPAVKRLEALYKYVKGLSAFKAYGLSSPHEFLAEGLSNPEFQQKLNQVRYKGATLWSRFARAIADILGIKYNTAFTELLSVYSDISTELEVTNETTRGSKKLKRLGILPEKPTTTGKPRRGRGAPEFEATTGMTINVDGVDRPTTNSNGRPIHPTKEGIRNFWRWFGDSKIVDAQGRPLVVYHGTAENFTAFDPGTQGSNYRSTGGQKGFFFTSSPGTASVYAEKPASAYLDPADPENADFGEGTANIMPVYLSLQRPLMVSTKQGADKYFDYNREKLYARAEKAGADGILVNGSNRMLYVAFRPTQIKSAVGNRGTFSPNAPEIEAREVPTNALKARQIAKSNLAEYRRDGKQVQKNRKDRKLKAGVNQGGGEASVSGGVSESGKVQVPQDKIGLTTGAPQTDLVPRFAPNRIAELVNKLPAFVRGPALWLYDTFGNFSPRAVAALGMGNQLLDTAVRYGITSARKYARLTRERGALVERRQEAFVRWAEEHNRLPQEYRGVGPGTANGMIEKMTRQGKWAFQPTYFRGDDAGVEVPIDTALKAEFDAFPKEVQRVIEQAFRLNYELVMDMKESVLDATNSEYDVLIANAQTDKEREKLKAEKAASLDQYRSMLTLRTDTPYAPLSRYGKYVVIGKSDAYLKAQQENDDAAIRAMQSDPDHYFVDYADSRAEAAQMRREILATYGGKDVNVQIAEKSEAEEDFYGGRDMMYAFQRLNNMITRGAEGTATARELRRRVTQLQLLAMATSSVRKAELQRRNVASGNLDMVKAILSRGRAGAHFIGSVYKNREIVDTLADMRAETKVDDGKREERQALYNGILARHVDGMAPRVSNSLADSMTSFTSLWMLGLAPSYYLQQGMQNFMLAVPQLAKTHGYSETMDKLSDGYKQVMKAWSGTGVTGQLDIEQVDEKYRALAHFLAESGELDVGINKEMGVLAADSGGVVSTTVKRVTDSIRALTRKIEAINRLSAGIATYDLELQAARKGEQITRTYDDKAYNSYVNDFTKAHPGMKPLTEMEFAAANNALRLITDAHGNYGMENTPLFLRGPVAQVLGQFQKFRIILAGLYIREIYNSFKGMTETERAVARRAVAYMTGHAAIAGGLIGSPFAVMFALVYNTIVGDDDERDDMERDIREAIGNETMANMLLRGLPTLAGVDVSGTLGQGNLLAVAPYTDIPTDRDSYAKYVLALLGPSIGGIGGNVFDAVELMDNGNYYKGMERLMPRGIMAASRSFREAFEGQTTRGGDVLVAPMDLSAVETMWGTIGLQPIGRANRQFAANQMYKDEQFYRDRTSDLKRAYVEAFKDNDMATISQIREDWRRLQDVKREKGIKPQPIMNLLSAPSEQAKREKQVIGGVPYTSSTVRQAEALNKLVTQ